MRHELTVFLFTFGLFLGMLLFLEIGRRIAVRRRKEDAGTAGEGIGAVDGAVFALLGLLIAFTFSGASSRFDTRRQLIVEETNDIGTAYLRLDLLPADLQPALRESFRRYLDARIEVYRKLPDLTAAKKSLAEANELQKQIWRQAVAASRAEGASLVSADPTASRAERDDRYHDDPNHGEPNASTDGRLRNAFRIGAGSFVISGLWHDRQQSAQLVSYAWVRAGRGVRCVCHNGYRVPALWFDSSGRLRPGFSRPAREHESRYSESRAEIEIFEEGRSSFAIVVLGDIVLPADNKWFTRVVVAAAVIEALSSLDLHYPKVNKEKLKELAAAKKALLAAK